MIESKIEGKSVTYAKSLGWLAYKFVSPSQRGVPDRMFIKNGYIFFVEFKTETGKLSRIQEKVIKDFRLNNIDVYIIRSFDDFKELIDEKTN